MEQQVLQTGTTAAILCPPGVSGEGRCSVGLRITPLLAGAVAAQLRGRERVAVCYDGTPAGRAAAELFMSSLSLAGGDCLWLGSAAPGPFYHGWSRGECALGIFFRQKEGIEAQITLPGGLPLTRRRRAQLNLELLRLWEKTECQPSLRTGRRLEADPFPAYSEMLSHLLGDRLMGCCCRIEGGPSVLRKLGSAVLCAAGVRPRGGCVLVLSATGEEASLRLRDGTVLPWERLVEDLCRTRLARGEEVALPEGLCAQSGQWPEGSGVMRYRPGGEDRTARSLAMLHPWVRDGLLAGLMWMTEQRENCRF